MISRLKSTFLENMLVSLCCRYEKGFTEETLPPVWLLCPLLVKSSKLGKTPRGKSVYITQLSLYFMENKNLRLCLMFWLIIIVFYLFMHLFFLCFTRFIRKISLFECRTLRETAAQLIHFSFMNLQHVTIFYLFISILRNNTIKADSQKLWSSNGAKAVNLAKAFMR